MQIDVAAGTTAKIVIPAKAGIQRNTGFPRIKYGAGLIKPGMTEWLGLMLSYIKNDLAAVAFDLRRFLLALTIWSCHAWVAPTFRLCHGLAAAVHEWEGVLKPKFLKSKPRSRTEFGMTKRAEMNSNVMLNPEGVMPNLFRHLSRAALFQHLVCSFSTVSRRSINKPSDPRPHEPLSPSGFTVIELIVVIVIIGILAATVIPKINFGTTSSTVSAWGAAYIIASDIRYTQECAMASMVSKGISFTSASFTGGQIVYTFPATTPSTSSLDPTGRLPSTVTIGTPNGTPFTFTFNSLGEPEESANNSVTVTVGGITRTITVTQYTGMVSIS